FERDIVPPFLPRQRWFGAKDRQLRSAKVLAHADVVLPAAAGRESVDFLASIVEMQFAGGDGQQRYFLPLAKIWGSGDSDLRQSLLPQTLAELRQVRREGALVDATSQEDFALALLEAIRNEVELPLRLGEQQRGQIRFRKQPAFERAP